MTSRAAASLVRGYSQAMGAEVLSARRRPRRAPFLEKALGRPPLVPDALRPWVLAVTIVAAGCLAGFGFYVRDSSRSVLFDRSVDDFLGQTSGFAYRVAILLSHVGEPKIFVTITAVVALALIVVGDFRAAFAAFLAVAAELVLVEEILKPFFDRRVAGLPGPTFPSGHTAVAMALAGVVVLAAGGARPLGRLLGPVWRHVLMAVALLLAGAVGVAMVILHLHYMSDVVVGVPLGLAVAGGTAVGLDTVANRWPGI